MEYVVLAVITIVAYLLGSINTSIIVSKFKNTDIREHGSGNAGLTNTLRTFGKGTAVIVLLGDILKAVIAILIAKYITPIILDKLIVVDENEIQNFIGKNLTIWKLTTLATQLAGIAVVLGHIFPIYYKFKGGKGVLTSATVIMMVNWQIGLICLGVFIIIVAVTRYVSLGSVMAAITFPCMVVSFDNFVSIGWVVFSTILMVLVIWCHRSNLKRLWAGEERRLSFKKKPEVE